MLQSGLSHVPEFAALGHRFMSIVYIKAPEVLEHHLPSPCSGITSDEQDGLATLNGNPNYHPFPYRYCIVHPYSEFLRIVAFSSSCNLGFDPESSFEASAVCSM